MSNRKSMMTLNVAFKDLTRRVISMHCFTLLFTRKNEPSTQDDKIMVTTHPDSSDMFQVTYSTPELRNGKKFVASFTAVLDYANDILTSMKHDMDPFEQIQVATSIHPIVLYHVSDMDEFATRDIIMNMLRDSLRFSVRLVTK